MPIDSGLQSKKWDGYFDENKDSIMGWWHRCFICHRIPSEIHYDLRSFWTIWHCGACNPKDYKPKNLWQKFWVLFDKL